MEPTPVDPERFERSHCRRKMLDADDIQAEDQDDGIGDVDGGQNVVRVADGTVHDRVVEGAPHPGQRVIDGTARRPGNRSRLGHRAVPREVRHQPHSRVDRGGGRGVLRQPNEVAERQSWLLAEVREHVAHVQVEVEECRLAPGLAGEGCGEVRGEEALAGSALRGEHSDDAALLGRPLRPDVPVTLPAPRPGEGASEGGAKVLPPAG